MKKKKLLAATMMAAGLLASSAAYSTDVNDWEGLKSGLTTGGDYTATGNITGSDVITVSEKTNSLNLNGKTLSGSNTEYAGINYTGGSLKIGGSGTISGFKSAGKGAITATSTPISMNVNSIVFDKNTSTQHGAAFYYKDQAATTGAVFNATAITFSDNISGASEGTSASSGGAILNTGGSLSLLGATNTFTGNKVIGTDVSEKLYKRGGGAIANQSYDNESTHTPINATMIIGKNDGSSTNTFSGNQSSMNGGAIMNRAVDTDGNATLTINGNTTFSGNTAAINGGAIYNAQQAGRTATVNLNNGTYTFKGNTAKNGGAIYNAGTMTIANAAFGGSGETDGNSSTSWGGAIYNKGSLSLSNTTFENNESGIGGAVANALGTSTITLGEDVTFKNNEAVYDGGAIGNYKGATLVNGTHFIGNKAQTSTSDVDAIGGGAMSLGAESQTKIAGATFENNTSGFNGGAIGTRNAWSANNTAAKLDVTGSTFEGNKANGGVTSSFKSGTISSTGGNGGAIDNHFYNSDARAGSAYVANSTFTSNEAKNGGAIYNNGIADLADKKASMYISDSTFTDNTATENGGAIYNGGTMTLSGTNTFSGNTANSVANDIYNTGTLNIGGTATLDGGIDGNSETIATNLVNITGGLTETSAIKNQTVNVNAGELHLTNGDANGSNIAGSTVAVKGDSVINTIDGVINDYADKITLNNGANVKLDVSLADTASADKFAIASGGVTINEIKVLTDISDSDTSKTVNVAEAGDVSIADGVSAFTTANKYTVAGNTDDNGKITLTKTAGAGGLKNAADDTGEVPATRDNVTYNVTGEDNSTSSGAATITNADMTIIGAGDSDTQKVVLSNDLTVGASATDNSTLTINEAKFEEGSTAAGKIINNEKATLNIKDSIIGVTIQNKGTLISDPTVYKAGIINQSGGDITVTDDIFQDNDRGADGGAVVNEVGGIFTANNATFVNNKATNKKGGAIYNQGTATINGGSFGDGTAANANTAKQGGAIYNESAIATTITGATFAGNYSTSEGGAIYNKTNSAKLTINDSTFTGNGYQGTTAKTSKGGAIYSGAGTDVEINNSTFTGNIATGQGGAINVVGSSTNRSTLNIIDSTLTNNTANALYGGGGIEIEQTDAVLDNTYVVSNTAVKNYGGGIVNRTSSDLTIKGDSHIDNNTSKTTGGGIYNAGSDTNKVTITASSVSGNTSNKDSAGNFVESNGGGGIYSERGTVIVEQGSKINNNIAKNSTGGGIRSHATTTIDASEVKGNSAVQGAGIYNKGTLTVSNGSTISENIATAVGDTKGLGGGIYNTGSGSVTIENSTFSGNQATNGGGAIISLGTEYTDGTVDRTGTIDITGGTFIANKSTEGSAGAIGAQSAGDITIDGVAFGDGTLANANTASTLGGVIHSNNTTFNIKGTAAATSFNYNTAANGGAISATVGSIINVENATFNLNKATADDGWGGAIYVDKSSLTIDKDTNDNKVYFTNNSADWGGAIAISGADAELSVKNAEFELNSADVAGGAISIANNIKSAIIDNVKFGDTSKGNTATGAGGAVWFGVDGAITNSTFTANNTTSATSDGGGAIFVGGGSDLDVINSTFTSNTSSTKGGAIATRPVGSSGSSSLNITGGTFSGNTAGTDGGAIWTEVKTVIANTNFTDNTATGNGGAISHTATDSNRFLEIIADGADVTFSGNKTGTVGNYVNNDIHNTGRLDLVATGTNSITLGGGITGDGDININKIVAGENDKYKVLNAGVVTDSDAITAAEGNVIFNGDVNAGNLNVAAGTLTNNAGLTVKSGENNGTIDGTNGTFTLNDDGADLVFDNNDSFTQKSLTIKSGNFKTDVANLHLTDDIKNDGTLTFTDTDTTDTVTIAQSIAKETSGGTVEIAGGANTVFSLGSGKSISDQALKLTSGTYNAGTATGAVDLTNFSSIIANGGTLSVQDGKTGAISLGKINTDASALKIAIDADLANTQGDKLSLTNELGTTPNNIQISSIKATSDPTATEFEFQIADDSAKAHIDMTSTTITSEDGLTPSIGNLLLTYDNTSGKLKGTHTDLANAITSTIPTKVYSMTENTTEQIGALTLGGNSLSITGNNSNITSTAMDKSLNGITINAAGQELSVTGATIGSSTNGFATAIDNTAGGTVNLTNVTMTGNTTDVANAGTLNLANTGTNTNSINTITGTGTTNIKTGTSTIGSLVQKAVTVEAPATLNIGADNLSTTDGTNNAGTLNLSGSSNDTPADLGSTITGTGNTNIAGNVSTDKNITQSAVSIGIVDTSVDPSVETPGNLTVTGDAIVEATNIGTTQNSSITANANALKSTNAIANAGTLNLGGDIDATATPAVETGKLASSITGAGTTNILGNKVDTNGNTIAQTTVNVGKAEAAPDPAVNSEFTISDVAGATALNATNLTVATADSKLINNAKGSDTVAGAIIGTLTNNGTVENNGTLSATTIDNNSALANAADSKVTATTINNSGSITNASAGTASGSVAGVIAANIINDGNGASITNNGTIDGAITNETDINNVQIANAGTITGNVDNGNGTNNVVGNSGSIEGDVTNNGGTINNYITTTQGEIKGNVINKAGTVNTQADKIATNTDAIVANDGTVNLTGSATATADNPTALSAAIVSITDGKGTTNIAGNVSSVQNITQDTINVGNDGTGSAQGSLTNTGNIVADDVNVTANGTLNQNGGSIIGTTATPATITNNGTTNINGGSVVADAINNEAGNTNIASKVNADKINAKGGAVNVDATANSVTKTSDLLANKAGNGAADVTIAEGAKVAVTTDNASLKVDNNIDKTTANNGKLELTGNDPGTKFDPAQGGDPHHKSDSEDVGTRFSVDPNKTINADVDLVKGELATDGSNINGVISAAADATVNAKDGKTSDVGDVNMTNGAYVKTDVNALTSKSDTFNDQNQGNNKYLTDLGIQDLDKFAYDHKSINLTEGTGLKNLQMTDALKANLEKNYSNVLTPIRRMDARVQLTDDGLMLNFTGTGNDYKDFNPAVMASPVAAQLGGYLVQLNSYDQAFNNMDMYMLMTKKQRQALKLRNKIAATAGTSVAFDPTMSQTDYAGGWFRPYASFEKVGLADGPKVENNSWGTFLGGESSMKDLGHGWDGMWGAYIGYNGAHQNYDGVGIYENGGTLGLVGMAYKDNFFVGATVNGGMMAAQANTMYGTEDFNMVMAGIAAKTGYNWELADGKFIIQPSLQTSYSFVNTFDYHNSANVYLESDALHAITIEPGIKFIGNIKGGWQPYAGLSGVFTIMDRTHFHANDVSLPALSVAPYAKYGIGLRKTWGERFSGFFQMFLMSGGRNGFGMQGGFKWAVGADGKGHITKDAKNPELKKTTVNLQNKKASVK